MNMIRKDNLFLLVAGISLITVFGCSNENKLEQVIRTELASAVRHDSLFLGLKFGIKQQDFYDQCWALNKQGLVMQGAENRSVEYLFSDSLDNPIAFNFYADMGDGDLIHRYNTNFYYSAWVLNRHLKSDRLMEMLEPILMDWYGGNELITLIKDGKKHLYKIDGNRMIDLYIHDEKTVVAIYSDLSYYHNPELR